MDDESAASQSEQAITFQNGVKAFEQGDFRRAEQLFATVENGPAGVTNMAQSGQRTDQVADACFWRAESQAKQNRHRAALATFRHYQESFPNGQYATWAAFRLIQTYKALAEFESAEKAVDSFVQQFPDSRLASDAADELPDIVFGIALRDFAAWKQSADTDRLASAKKRLEAHLRRFPNDRSHAKVCYYLGRVLLVEKDFPTANHVFVRAIERFPDDAPSVPFARYYLGESCQGLGDVASARQHWQAVFRAIGTPPSLAAACQEKTALSYRDRGDNHAAIREFLRLATVFEHDEQWRKRGLSNAAECYAAIGDARSADRMLAKCATHPANPATQTSRPLSLTAIPTSVVTSFPSLTSGSTEPSSRPGTKFRSRTEPLRESSTALSHDTRYDVTQTKTTDR